MLPKEGSKQEEAKITLDQETYIESVIETFKIQDSNPSKTPAETNLKLVKATENEQLFDERLYRSLVGSLLYIAKQTRPDIVWIVNVLSRFMDKPSNTKIQNDALGSLCVLRLGLAILEADHRN